MKQYWGLSEFYYDYEEKGSSYRVVPIEKVDRLIERLHGESYCVRELKNGRIIVRSPEEIEASQKKRRAIQAQAASKFTKLGAAFPKEIVRQFAEACRKLGCTQSEVLMAVIEDTINKARAIDESEK